MPLRSPLNLMGSFRLGVSNWRAVTGLFFVSTLLESLALGHLTAFRPLMLRNELQVPPGDVGPWTGYLTAATFAIAFPLAPFWGSLAERYSRRAVIVRSQFIEAVGYTLCGFAPDLKVFFLGHLLLGLTFGNIAIIIATQSLLTPDRRMASAIAVVQAANPIAVSAGPPIGAFLLPVLGLRGLFMLDGVACLVAGILVTLLMPEPPGRDTSKGVLANMRASVVTVWQRPAVRWNFVSWYLSRGGMNIVDTYLPVRITELVADPAPAIGLILGVYGFLTTVATWATGRIVDRLGPARLFWPAMLVAAASGAGMALSPVVPLVALFTWVRSVPVALTNTVLYAHLAQVLTKEERAPIMSLTPAPRNLAQFTWPLVAAAAASISTGAALGVAAIVYGGSIVSGLLLRPAPESRPEGDDENEKGASYEAPT